MMDMVARTMIVRALMASVKNAFRASVVQGASVSREGHGLRGSVFWREGAE